MTNRLPTALVLASASSASAAIVVFDINPDFQATHTTDRKLEVGTLNFSNGTFGNFGQFFVDNYATYKSVYIISRSANFLVGSNLISSGVSIDAGISFSSLIGFSHLKANMFAPSVGTHYIALSNSLGGGNRYGWIEFTAADADGIYNNYTFTRFAFNDIAGQSILAGQTTAIPEASTLGLVGGLFGLVAAAHLRRRKLKQAAASDKFLALAAGEKLN